MGEALFWMANNLMLIRPLVLLGLIALVIACFWWIGMMTIDDD